MDGYYYLHTNGDLIFKRAMVVDGDPDYFDSPFVKKVWPLSLSDRSSAWTIIIESLALGANVDRVAGLAKKWGCTPQDLPEFMCRKASKPTVLEQTGLHTLITEIWKQDYSKLLEHIATTPEGETVDMSRFMPEDADARPEA